MLTSRLKAGVASSGSQVNGLNRCILITPVSVGAEIRHSFSGVLCFTHETTVRVPARVWVSPEGSAGAVHPLPRSCGEPLEGCWTESPHALLTR